MNEKELDNLIDELKTKLKGMNLKYKEMSEVQKATLKGFLMTGFCFGILLLPFVYILVSIVYGIKTLFKK